MWGITLDFPGRAQTGLSHIYGAIESMEIRCKRLERVANSQLRAMVSTAITKFLLKLKFLLFISFVAGRGS